MEQNGLQALAVKRQREETIWSQFPMDPGSWRKEIFGASWGRGTGWEIW